MLILIVLFIIVFVIYLIIREKSSINKHKKTRTISLKEKIALTNNNCTHYTFSAFRVCL